MENRYQAVAKVTRVLSEDYEPQGEEDREGDLQKKSNECKPKFQYRAKPKILDRNKACLSFRMYYARRGGGKEARSLTAETSPTNFSSSVCSSSN